MKLRNRILLAILALTLWIFPFQKAYSQLFIQGGATGAFDMGFGDNIDLGNAPGVFGALGIRGDVFGIRASVLWSSFSPTLPANTDLYAGSLDLLLYPLSPGDLFKLYLALGIGAYYFDPQIHTGSSNTPGLGGNIGVGIEIPFGKMFSFSIENNFRPMIFFVDNTLLNVDTQTVYIWTLSGILTVQF